MSKKLLSAAFVLCLALGPAAAQAAVVRYGPPPPRREIVRVARGPRYVWVPGYYRWRRHSYVWVPGYYVIPPRPRAIWVPGYWASRRGGYFWVGGYWR